jgi:hypothetical protein
MPDRGRPRCRGPANDDRLARLLDEDRRRVLGAIVESAPPFVAGLLIERHDARAFRAEDDDQELFVHDRRRRDSPDRHAVFGARVALDLVLGVEVALPNDIAALAVEAMQVTHRAESISAGAVNRHRGARAGGIADGVFAWVIVAPKRRPRLLVEAMDPFDLLRFCNAVGDEHAPLGDGRPAVARRDRHAPLQQHSPFGQFIDDARLAPLAVAAWASPLGPVFSGSRRKRNEERGKRDCE